MMKEAVRAPFQLTLVGQRVPELLNDHGLVPICRAEAQKIGAGDL